MSNVDTTGLVALVLCSCDFIHVIMIFRYYLGFNTLIRRPGLNNAVLNCTLMCVSLEQVCCVLLLATSLMDNG